MDLGDFCGQLWIVMMLVENGGFVVIPVEHLGSLRALWKIAEFSDSCGKSLIFVILVENL